MSSKFLFVLAMVFASCLIGGSIGALNRWSIPIPERVSLIPSSNFNYVGATYTYNATTHRHTTVNVTVQNVGVETLNCTVEVHFLQNSTQIAYGINYILNMPSMAINNTIVTLSWTDGKNLTHVTSDSYVLIY